MRLLIILLLFSSTVHADYTCTITDLVEPGADAKSIKQPAIVLTRINPDFRVKATGDIEGAYATTGYRHQTFRSRDELKIVSISTEDDQKLIQVFELYTDLDGLSFNRYIGTLGSLLVGYCTKNP